MLVQPVVSDPAADLLAFSMSFKKVRRADTVKSVRYVDKRNVNDNLSFRGYRKVRSTSLPNPKDLYAVVRDNDKRQTGAMDKVSNSNELIPYKKSYQRNRFNSLFALVSAFGLHSSSYILSNGYSASDNFGLYMPSIGIDKTAQLLKSPIILIPKLILNDTMKRKPKVC
uniref:Uncharacterized protein n=1 Tax=Setaria digitata TaxID=48799 RepID=A0A915Q3B7_9BILA